MALKIINVAHDGLTGHITIRVRVVEELTPGNTSHGPEETVFITPAALLAKFHDSSDPTDDSIAAALQAWLADHHTIASERKRLSETCSSAVHKLKGQRLEFGR